jgi:hypothetical protein
VYASIRSSLAVLSFLAVAATLPACAATASQGADAPRSYRDTLVVSEATLRSQEENPAIPPSHDRARQAQAHGAFTTTNRLGR